MYGNIGSSFSSLVDPKLLIDFGFFLDVIKWEATHLRGSPHKLVDLVLNP